jgi:hypothetical protein
MFRVVLLKINNIPSPTAMGSGVASPTIQSRYANIAMFINYQHNQLSNEFKYSGNK